MSINSCFTLLTFTNVSIIANVTSTDFLLLGMVANIYNPFSVNTLGKYLFLFDTFAVENFDRKTCY